MLNKRAILLLTRNSSHVFKYFIKSFNAHVDKNKYDLFLWDNGSRGGDVEYLKLYEEKGMFKACIFREENWLFTHAINGLLGLAQSMDNYEQFLIMNPDIEFCEKWDKDLDTNIGIMGFLLVKENGIIEHYGAYGNGEHFARGDIYEESKYTETRETPWVTFGAVSLHRNVLKECGGLNETYPHFGSDREYCKLAKSRGFPITCSSRKLVHGFGKSSKPYIFSDIPDKIWKKHIQERRLSGINFPENQEDVYRIDAPGRYLKLTK